MFKNNIKYVFSILIFIVILFFLINVSLAQEADSCENGQFMCNTSSANWLQVCTNCDSDPEQEWCNIRDCSQKNLFCVDNLCQDFKCLNGQQIGDINNDNYINNVDIDYLYSIVSSEKGLSGEKCCVDINSDGDVNKDDIKDLENAVNNNTYISGKCDIKEKNKIVVCDNDDQCDGEETNKNCPNDCKIIKTEIIGSKITKKIIFAAAALLIVIIAIALVYVIKTKRKNKSSNNNPSPTGVN